MTFYTLLSHHKLVEWIFSFFENIFDFQLLVFRFCFASEALRWLAHFAWKIFINASFSFLFFLHSFFIDSYFLISCQFPIFLFILFILKSSFHHINAAVFINIYDKPENHGSGSTSLRQRPTCCCLDFCVSLL